MNSKERERFRGRPASPRRYQPTCFAFKKGDCRKGNDCGALFTKKRNCKFGKKCAFKHTEQEPKRRQSSVVVAKTLDHTQARSEVSSLNFIAKGDFLHGVSGISVKLLLSACVVILRDGGRQFSDEGL